MNKLKTDDAGGMPLELDDIRFEQDAVREAFYGIISAFGIAPADSFKLSGCEVTIAGNDYTTTDGYICLNGEVLKVVAHTITKSALHDVKWDVEVTYDPAGTETFKDGTTGHETYEVRRGVLVSVAAVVPPNYMQHDAPYLTEVIFETEGWRNVGGGGNPAFLNGWANQGGGSELVAFQKDSSGVVYLKGTAQISPGSGAAIFTLPVGYRPGAERFFYDGPNGVQIGIGNDGHVFPIALPDPTTVHLDGVCFKI
jgi:hypothetical protein